MTDFVLYIVMLTNSVPKELIHSLGSYVHKLDGTHCLISPRFEFDHHSFIKLEILPPADDKPRTIWLPIGLILAVEALESKEDARKMGFLATT